MNKTKFLKLIFELNEIWLNKNEFLSKKKNFEFIKTDPNGYCKVSISCAKVGTRFYLTYGLIIRINTLEKILNPFTGLDESLWYDTASILTSAIYLKEDINNKQYIIDSEADIEKVNKDFQNLMNEKGFDWFKKYENNISILDKELNENIELAPIYLQLTMVPFYGIVSAKLNNNKSYKAIVKKHLSFWQTKANENIAFKINFERVQRLVANLSKMD